MKNENLKLNKKLKNIKKLVPGLILFSFVLSGILAPVSIVKNYPYKNIAYGAPTSPVITNDGLFGGNNTESPGSRINTIPVTPTTESSTGGNTGGNNTSPVTPQRNVILGGEVNQPGSRLNTGAPVPSSDQNKNLDNSPFNCNILTEFAQCVGTTIYTLIFVPATYILTLSGWLFDITIAFTLSKNILDIDFAKGGWTVTRDLANMFFIFILLYIAIATILNIAGYNAKALLARLIIVALLLNFSLFVTRVVIDASNILALSFYDSISAPARAGDIGEVSSLVKFFDVKPKGISSGLVSFFDPQKLLGSDQVGAKKIADFAKSSTGKLIFIYLFSAVIILVTAWAFFTVAFLFITRTAVLWFLMATAPLAFSAIILPKTRSLFGKWMDELISKSFCVAVFLFFLWLITKFAERGIFQSLSDPSGRGLVGGLGDSNDNALLFTMIIILLQFSILLVLILVAKQQTQKMCGAVAGFSMNFVSGLGSKAAGLLAGGVGGFALRNTLGQYAYKKAEEWNKAGYGGGNLGARLALQAARKVSGAGFDIRATKLGKEAELGEASGKKGYAGWVKERTAKDVAFAKSFGKGPVADEARTKFAENLKGMGLFSRMVTGRGVLSKTQQKKASGDVEDLVKATDKIRREEAKMDELTEKLIGVSKDNPLKIKDESGVEREFSGIAGDSGLSEAVRKREVNAEKAADIIDGMVKSRSDELINKLDAAKARVASANRQRTPDELAKNGRRIAREIEDAAKELSETERMIEWSKEIKRLDERKRDRTDRETREASREASQKSSSGGGDKDKK